jgi:ubiquinone/menaquinone biosynthesis C-methylase UbiE
MTHYLNTAIDFEDPQTAAVFEEFGSWMLRFGHLLLDNLEIRRDQRILDVACGTGFPLFDLAQIHGKSCRVTGVDIWKAALDRARSKLQLLDLANVDIIEADAAHLPFRDAEFDLLVSNLGVNNFDDPTAVLRECFRVAKPRARLALTTNVEGHMREFYEVYRDVLRQAGKNEALARLRTNEAHRGTRESVTQLVERAGFAITKVVETNFSLRYLDGTTLFNHLLTRFGFLEGWRAVAGPADEKEVFGALEEKLNSIAAERGELKLTIPMLYVEARKR